MSMNIIKNINPFMLLNKAQCVVELTFPKPTTTCYLEASANSA